MAYSSTFALVAVLALVMSPLASGLTLCSPSIAQDSCVPELFSGRAGGTNPPTHEEFHWAATAAEMTGISSWVFTFSDDDYLGGYMHWAVIDIPVTETSIPQGQAYTGQGTELKSYQGNGAGGTNRYRYAIHGLPVTNSGLNIDNNKLYPQLKSEIAALGGITFEFSSLYTNSDANPGNCPPPVPPFECPLAGSADGLNADGSPIDGGQGFFTPGTTTFTIIIIVVVVAVVGAVGFLVYRMKASGSSSGGGDWGKAAQGYAVNSGGNGQWGGNNNGGGGNAYAAQQSGYGQPQQQQQYGNGNGYGQQQQQQQRQAPPPPSNYGRY